MILFLLIDLSLMGICLQSLIHHYLGHLNIGYKHCNYTIALHYPLIDQVILQYGLGDAQVNILVSCVVM